MIFNKIYEKLDDIKKDIENLKQNSTDTDFDAYGILQNQYHEIKANVELMHEKIHDLTLMLVPGKKRRVSK